MPVRFLGPPVQEQTIYGQPVYGEGISPLEPEPGPVTPLERWQRRIAWQPPIVTPPYREPGPVREAPPVDQPPRCEVGYVAQGSQCVPIRPTPVFQPPIRISPPTPTPPPSSGPVWKWRPRRMPRPVVRRPYKPREEPKATPSTPVGELCPVAGYVRRPIPGVAEEQIFRCDPGRPVVIDPGLREAGRAEAAARYGLHGLFDNGNGDNTWLWVAGAVAVYYFFVRKAR